MDILDEIVAHKKLELATMKAAVSERDIHRQVEQRMDMHTAIPSMRGALMASGSGIIAEFKRKSPSKGWIKEAGRADDIPLAYERGGAAALSILTDSHYFGGDDKFITEARRAGVALPILYKNFVIDEYQLFQARLCGASAVLLIAACLDKRAARQLLLMAHELGLEVLLETHSEAETEYADIEPDMCGVNNRNLGTFITDMNNSFRLASRLPSDACKVSESGISAPATVASLRLAGYNGFLIGEYFMRSEAPGESLKSFIYDIKTEKIC